MAQTSTSPNQGHTTNLRPLATIDAPASKHAKFRRNGKPQSCEPCRKSKLRCDHVVPACGRCVRARRIDQCFYHPNPLTKSTRIPPSSSLVLPATQPVLTPSTSTASPNSRAHSQWASIEESEPSESPSPVFDSRQEAAAPLPRPADLPPPYQRCASAPPGDPRGEAVTRGSLGYLGATNYTAIFSEGLRDGNIDGVEHACEQTYILTVSNDRIVRGCQILALLKDRHMINRLVARWYELCEGTGTICPEFMMKEFRAKLWAFHGDTISSQDPVKIRRLSEMLWRNTQNRLTFDGKTTAKEWTLQATGMNIRWEVIGLVAVTAALCANCLAQSDPLFSELKSTRRSISKRMSEVSEACLEFCRECDMLDDLFLWLLMENAGLIGAVQGDGYASYTATGELNSATIAMGLHQGIKASDKLPFFLAEIRKKFMASTYAMEVGGAAFLGRPPRLSYRYCVLDEPVDLSDHQLSLEGADLAAAIAQLDQNGYNTVGRWQRTTWVKAYLGLAPRREDIVDLALGRYTRDEVIERSQVIQRKMDEHWEALPEFIRLTRHEPVDFSSLKMKPLEAMYVNIARQASRANELLLQRILIRKTGASSEKLIHVARDIFKDILAITSRHDIAAMFQMDLTALLVAHGLRSGAIVAVELLKQEQLPVYPEKPLLPRSETIQELAVFAARLGQVDPSDGTFLMCDQGRKIIGRILDRILSPKPARQPAVAPNNQQSGQGPMDVDGPSLADASLGLSAVPVPVGLVDMPLGMEAPLGFGQDMDFMHWLETVDWERTDTWNAF